MNDNQDSNLDLPIKWGTTCEKIKNFRQLQQSIRPSVGSFKHEYLCNYIECIPMKLSLAGSSGNATKYLLTKLLGILLALGLT